MDYPPTISVGIMDRQAEISGRLDGNFQGIGFGPLSGAFSARCVGGEIALDDDTHRPIYHSAVIRLKGGEGTRFRLFHVIIGSRFHWERREDQIFHGDLVLRRSGHGTIAAINEIPMEDYLTSVISSEMSAAAPIEFLKAHAILSRSWLLAALGRRGKTKGQPGRASEMTAEEEVLRWYDREEHDLFDVCADDHCQRYQGITKAFTPAVEAAVRETSGVVLIHEGEICDARYSKACGGLTENFETAWEDKRVPYLRSISDASMPHSPVRTEEEAGKWILTNPEAYCGSEDNPLLNTLLSDVDWETKSFFRWRIDYRRAELEGILREKSGFDFGTLQEIVPLRRGPSGRISQLKIIGSKRTVTVGKELEIRRWLSRTHLYSSAFIVHMVGDRFTLHGAGWGHGVGLCQIGAAVMATRGFSAGDILKHYFKGVEIKKIY